MADLLAVEFSKANYIHLLERAEIARVYREQTLAAGNGDYLKLGQVLGADGLLFLGTNTIGSDQFLTIDLIAVKAGVILSEQRFKWPLERSAEWAPAVARQIEPLTPKLGVLAKDAIPISVVNLRSAMQMTEAREAERQLTLLAIERLSQEPRLFVLERRRMESLASEKELKGVGETAFWDGSYLLDGTLDNNGYSEKTITLTARLVPPKGGAPVKIEVSGNRANYTEVINRLADKVLVSLKLGRSTEPWNADEEAEQFYAEARWALKWNLYPQARAAAESAWALGKRNSDSAGALFQAYSESAPRDPLYPRDVSVQAFPEADQFPRLIRALEILSQNPTKFFCGTNSSTFDRFSLAYEALFAAACQVESYYYAAEARVGHEEQLADLREKMRDAFKAMNAHPVSATNLTYRLQDARVCFDTLAWSEYGACFEQPEDAVPAYRELLNRGIVPKGLPRFIGWTWKDRQRVPHLMHEFIEETCANTNPAVRIKGLYLALLWDPGDENGSLQRAEQNLISAMWDHREVIFSSPENASLVERTKEALEKRYDDYSYFPFNHEPFASFKHRLRMDFLEHMGSTNPAVVQELFIKAVPARETAEQARELLPLVVSYRQKLAHPGMVDSLISHLRGVAGLPRTNSEVAGPVHPAEEMVNAKFIPWNLKQPNISPNRRPSFYGAVLREGRIWVRVQYSATNSWSRWDDIQTTYLAVDPQSGVTDEIHFPEEFGTPGALFEVSSDALFVESGGHLYRFKFSQRVWDEISTPVEGSTRLVWLKDRLFISRSDGLISVQPDTKSIQVLASSRRQPPANAADSLWESRTLIYAQTDGRLGALTESGCLTFDPVTEQWNMRPMPQGTNRYRGNSARFSSPAGSQWLLSGLVVRHYLVGFWNDNQPCQSLLRDEAPFSSPVSIDEKLLNPVRWDWPSEYSLEPASVYADDQKLWVLCPRIVPPAYGYVLKKPVQFADNRDATVFYFDPEFRGAISVPVKFEITDPSMNPFSPKMPELRMGQRWSGQIGNIDFWTKTPAGLAFANPQIGGHWLVPDAALEPKLELQRQALRKSSTARSNQASLEKT
ncbi:MAG TPA: hypothetical protein VHC44_14910 [Verrucomicrobiae bacterium]|nr:hypothetical protein [Verrucomicrobiae bacterium]